LAAPSLQFARLEQSIPLESGVSMRTITVQRREGRRANDPVVEDFARLWRIARNFNLRRPPTPVSVDPAKLAAALAAAHRRDMRLVQLISERVTVGGQRGHRDPRSLRVAIAATNSHHADDFGGQLASYALPPGDPDDADVQFVPDPTLTDGEALYEAGFGPDELRTDFWDATAQTVIASVLGFIDDENRIRCLRPLRRLGGFSTPMARADWPQRAARPVPDRYLNCRFAAKIDKLSQHAEVLSK
jgi:hypothetical protein